jgi:DNA-directed RNA polymerase II subunit RPB2
VRADSETVDPTSQDPYAYDDPQYGFMDENEDAQEVTQEDCWTVITSFFDKFGLVRQQIDSFDEFVQNTMQELVDENAELILDQADQHSGGSLGGSLDATRRYNIKFGQIYLSRPNVTEADGSVVPIFPQEARLRNLTYSAPLYIEMTKKTEIGREDPDTGEMVWEEERAQNADDTRKVWIGKVRALFVLCLSLANGMIDSHHASF